MLINEADFFDQHVEAQYANKPYLVALKRVWRMAKKMPNQEKPKKIGFYLQMMRKLQGSAKVNEKMIRDILGKSQEMTPAKFIKGVFSHGVPEGKKLYIKPETAYQSTQRLMPDRSSGGRDNKTGLNKTIQVSVFGDIYDKILDKYEGRKDADYLFRMVNKYLSSHFANAAAFLRWTVISPNWVHIDAFQTDFFNNLRKMGYEEEKNTDIQNIVKEFGKYEDEFFKTALSYVVRTNPGAKIFTANTPNIVQQVENISSSPKRLRYYHQLPKKLGFKLVPLTKIEQIVRTRPGQSDRKGRKTYNKAEAMIKKFSGAVKGLRNSDGKKVIASNLRTATVAKNLATIAMKGKVSNEAIDSVINKTIDNEKIQSAYHQLLDGIRETMQKATVEKQKMGDKGNVDVKAFIQEYLTSKKTELLTTANKTMGGEGIDIWWANRGTIFESVDDKKKTLMEEIKQLSRY